MVLIAGLLCQCQKLDDAMPLSDDDSDRPEWAGGNTDANYHINKNEDSATTRGGDYGDLFRLLRDVDGVPIMIGIAIEGSMEYFVQPVDADGIPIQLDAYGEIPEGAPTIEVEFGRLNIVRSPQSVLDQAFEEAMDVLEAPGAVISLDFCGRLTSTYPDPISSETIVKTIDSPRESLALYQYLMKFMFQDTEENNWNNRLKFLGDSPYNFDPLIIAASCFAAGSDKTGTVNIDEVVYINGFIDCIGLNPILNENDYDFNHNQNYYFNFSEPKLGDAQFKYNREVYASRYLQIITLNSNGTYTEEIKTVKDAMEDKGLFSCAWGEIDNKAVSGFALAVDDAVQVLDYVHGDSNVTFLPDYLP